jgi:hypothetical protein
LFIPLILGLPSLSFLLDFSSITYINSTSPPVRAICLATSSSLTYHSNYTWRRVQVMELLIIQRSPARFVRCIY